MMPGGRTPRLTRSPGPCRRRTTPRTVGAGRLPQTGRRACGMPRLPCVGGRTSWATPSAPRRGGCCARPVESARVAADLLDEAAVTGLGIAGRTLAGSPGAVDLVRAEPRGVVAVLTPWNDPFPAAAGLLAAALVTGNTVVHKPSERSAVPGALMGALVADCLPPGVLQLLCGGGDVGAQLAADGRVAVVAHVGSSATGRTISAVAGARGPGRCWRTAARTRSSWTTASTRRGRPGRSPPVRSPTPASCARRWSASTCTPPSPRPSRPSWCGSRRTCSRATRGTTRPRSRRWSTSVSCRW